MRSWMNHAGIFVLISVGIFLYSWEPDFPTAGVLTLALLPIQQRLQRLEPGRACEALARQRHSGQGEPARATPAHRSPGGVRDGCGCIRGLRGPRGLAGRAVRGMGPRSLTPKKGGYRLHLVLRRTFFAR